MNNKLIDHQERSILEEGKDYGLGFAFVKKKKDAYHTVQPISPCKDYLNDVIEVEKKKASIGEVHGLKYEPCGVFNTKNAFLAMKICLEGSIGEKEYIGYDKDVKKLNNDYILIQHLINEVEDILNIGHTEIFESDNKGVYIIKAPLFWIKYGYLISLYSALLRMFLYAKEEDSYLGYLESERNSEKYLYNSFKKKFAKILKGELPVQSFNTGIDHHKIHNGGIVEMKFT